MSEQNWEIIDTKILKEMRQEISSLKEEISNFKSVVSEINKRNEEIKVYLESNRVLYSKAIKDNYSLLEQVQNILSENRQLYMKAFKDENIKLQKLEKITEDKISPDNILRKANLKWRSTSTVPSLRNTVMKY